jgi:hypothetical protein
MIRRLSSSQITDPLERYGDRDCYRDDCAFVASFLREASHHFLPLFTAPPHSMSQESNAPPPAPTGACACGAVQYTIHVNKQAPGAPDILSKASMCHCTICQAWAGGILVYIEVPTSKGHDVTITQGSDKVSSWRSSKFCERAFCKICGSSLYCRMEMPGPMDGMYHVCAGTLAQDTASGPDGHPIRSIKDEFFVDRKPSAYTIDGHGLKMTSHEFMALWSDKDDEGAETTEAK